MLKNNSGSALATLLIFVATGIIVISAAVSIALINTQATSDLGSGESVLQIAESGAEEAIQRLLRDYEYSGGTIDFDNGAAVISVTGNETKTIESIATLGDFERTIQVTAEISDDTITITDWTEIN